MPQSGDFSELYQLGVARAQQGHAAQARFLLERALAQQPDQPDALVALGNVLNMQGHGDLALANYQQALRENPEHAGALINMGSLFHSRRQYEKAVGAYDHLLAGPGQILCLVNRALSLHELGRLPEAILTLDYALMMAPSAPDVLLARGNAHQAAQNHSVAEADYRKVILLRPSDIEARVGLATALSAQGDHVAGLTLLDEVLRTRPGHCGAHSHRGDILREMKRLTEAEKAYDDALANAPNLVRAQRNKGLCLLLAGDFPRGLPLYEWRKRLSVPVESRAYPVPLWTGTESLSGKRLFLYSEQGLGDTLQFFRFVKPLKEMGARVILSCQDQLLCLLTAAGREAEIIGSDRTPARFDYHCPLLSVPLALNLRENTIPVAVPYLRADRQRVEYWAGRIGSSGFRIGVCWQGASGADGARSFPLAELADISRIEGVRLISLQKGLGTEQLTRLPGGMTVESLEPLDPAPHAFLDTAAIMMSLDLIVTPDTSIAHLAGALARPACLMLKEVPDWRWMLDRDDSPWYPTVRLFRQPGFVDWRGAFKALGKHIAELIVLQPQMS